AVRTTVAKPVSENAIRYVPGRKSTMVYRPSPSVTTLRALSINTGLDASTVTPGSTAPLVSLMTPEKALCASAATGGKSKQAMAAGSPDPVLRHIHFLQPADVLPNPDPTRRTNERPWRDYDQYERVQSKPRCR